MTEFQIMTSLSSDLLLHPELLTNEQLISVIQERHLKVPTLLQMSRDSLLELFHQYCVPYAQRRYRDSGRGKLLNKNRQNSIGSPQTVTNMEVEYSHQKNYKPDPERLKPPPDLLTGHIKKIKLSLNVETKSSIHNNELNLYKRKLAMVDVIKDSPPVKKERKPITWP